MASPSSRGRRQQPAAASFVSQDVHAGTTRFPTPVGTPSCSRSPSPSHSESTQSLMDALTRTVREPIWMHPLGWRTEQLSLLRVSILDDGAPPVPSMGSSLPPGCVPSWWNSRLEAAVELGMSIEVLHRMLVQSVLCMFQTRERPWFQMPESCVSLLPSSPFLPVVVRRIQDADGRWWDLAGRRSGHCGLSLEHTRRGRHR